MIVYVCFGTDTSMKSGIQGFYDPAPSLAKSLRVRYNFRGHAHYAEIPDYMPVVLPLEGVYL
jgi:DnaJ family protein C protein 11